MVYMLKIKKTPSAVTVVVTVCGPEDGSLRLSEVICAINAMTAELICEDDTWSSEGSSPHRWWYDTATGRISTLD